MCVCVLHARVCVVFCVLCVCVCEDIKVRLKADKKLRVDRERRKKVSKGMLNKRQSVVVLHYLTKERAQL